MAEMVKESKFQNFQKNLTRFLKEIRSELKKVIWPNKTQLINNTFTVLMCCIIVGALIWAFDAGLAQLVKMFLA